MGYLRCASWCQHALQHAAAKHTQLSLFCSVLFGTSSFNSLIDWRWSNYQTIGCTLARTLEPDAMLQVMQRM